MNIKKQGSGVSTLKGIKGQGPETNSKLKTRNSKLIFVTGGARSGKSAFALNLANSMGNRKCYMATAQALDAEMEERIARHKAERGPDWDSIEEPLKVAEKIQDAREEYDVILFDCLTLWVSNLMLKDEKPEVRSQTSDVENLIDACKKTNATTIVVSNEVGLGIVPDNALARKFRDLAGTANQLFARAADEAYFVVSGISIKLK